MIIYSFFFISRIFYSILVINISAAAFLRESPSRCGPARSSPSRPPAENKRKENRTMVTQRRGNVMEVNLHGLTAPDAKRQLEQRLSRIDAGVTERVVIHGYNNGQVLRDMVRKQLKHPRIQAKLLSLNPGQTRILLK